jgi:transcription elongation factor GreA-like protein
MTFKTGQYVHHTKYGNGIIVERDEDRTTVDFDTAGLKKFVTSIASFEMAEGEAPKRKRTVRRKAKSTEIGTPVVM